MIDVLVVSPLATVRAGLASLLAAAGGLLVVGEAASLESGVGRQPDRRRRT